MGQKNRLSKSMHYCQIKHNFMDSEYLCKLAKNIFTPFSRQILQTFEILHASLLLTVAKLSTIKNSPVFLAHHVVLFLTFHVICSSLLKTVSCKTSKQSISATDYISAHLQIIRHYNNITIHTTS